MFDVGFFELVLVFVMALLILGPERLPKVARSVGHWMGKARASFNNLRYELEREAMNEEMRRKFSKQLEELGIDEDSLSGNPQVRNTESSSDDASASGHDPDSRKPSDQ